MYFAKRQSVAEQGNRQGSVVNVGFVASIYVLGEPIETRHAQSEPYVIVKCIKVELLFMGCHGRVMN